MIENLLLDPLAIWDLLQPYREILGIADVDGVTQVLDQIFAAQASDEVRLRVLEETKGHTTRLSITSSSDVDAAIASAQSGMSSWLDKLGGATKLKEIAAEEQSRVATILTNGSANEKFHGKNVLKSFYSTFNLNAFFSYHAFVIELARKCKNHPRLTELTNRPMQQIELYVPDGLLPTLRRLADNQNGANVTSCQALAETVNYSWGIGNINMTQYSALRRQLNALVAVLDAPPLISERDQLRQIIAEMR